MYNFYSIQQEYYQVVIAWHAMDMNHTRLTNHIFKSLRAVEDFRELIDLVGRLPVNLDESLESLQEKLRCEGIADKLIDQLELYWPSIDQADMGVWMQPFAWSMTIHTPEGNAQAWYRDAQGLERHYDILAAPPSHAERAMRGLLVEAL